MFSEILLLVFLVVLSSQSSALWSSLNIIPLSLIVILLSSSMNIFSGLFIIMYMMVFIGGLLILLMSVSSISFQEQSYSLTKLWLMFTLFLCIPLLSSFKTINNYSSLILSVSWFESQSNIILLMLMIIFISLIIMSKMVLSFKGMIRSI